MPTNKRGKSTLPKPHIISNNGAKTILVIPDPHSHYLDSSTERALWAGRLAVDLKPEIVVEMGDLADMPSLFAFDQPGRNLKTAEIGPTYKADCDAARRWSDQFFAPLKAARKTWRPRTVALIGNHSERISRVIRSRLELPLGYGDLGLEESGWGEVVPYVGTTPGIIEIQGILFAHYFVAGSFAKPINSFHAAANITNKLHCSTVSAHTHLASYYSAVGGEGRRIQGLVCGWYGDESNAHVSSYCGLGSRAWWNGVVILHGAEAGNYDLEWVSTARLKRLYG